MTRQSPETLRRLLRAKDRMDAAFETDINVASLAKIAGMSSAHFARAFRLAFGTPPHRYLLTRRIERAAALLRDTDLPIIEIALSSGWNSLGTFGRVFHDILGASPTELRKKEREKEHQLAAVPHCFVAAAHRPALRKAVSEKRRAKKQSSPDGV